MTRLKELLKKARSVKKSDEILDELFSSIKEEDRASESENTTGDSDDGSASDSAEELKKKLKKKKKKHKKHKKKKKKHKRSDLSEERSEEESSSKVKKEEDGFWSKGKAYEKEVERVSSKKSHKHDRDRSRGDEEEVYEDWDSYKSGRREREKGSSRRDYYGDRDRDDRDRGRGESSRSLKSENSYRRENYKKEVVYDDERRPVNLGRVALPYRVDDDGVPLPLDREKRHYSGHEPRETVYQGDGQREMYDRERGSRQEYDRGGRRYERRGEERLGYSGQDEWGPYTGKEERSDRSRRGAYDRGREEGAKREKREKDVKVEKVEGGEEKDGFWDTKWDAMQLTEKIEKAEKKGRYYLNTKKRFKDATGDIDGSPSLSPSPERAGKKKKYSDSESDTEELKRMKKMKDIHELKVDGDGLVEGAPVDASNYEYDKVTKMYRKKGGLVDLEQKKYDQKYGKSGDKKKENKEDSEDELVKEIEDLEKEAEAEKIVDKPSIDWGDSALAHLKDEKEAKEVTPITEQHAENLKKSDEIIESLLKKKKKKDKKVKKEKDDSDSLEEGEVNEGKEGGEVEDSDEEKKKKSSRKSRSRSKEKARHRSRSYSRDKRSRSGHRSSYSRRDDRRSPYDRNSDRRDNYDRSDRRRGHYQRDRDDRGHRGSYGRDRDSYGNRSRYRSRSRSKSRERYREPDRYELNKQRQEKHLRSKINKEKLLEIAKKNAAKILKSGGDLMGMDQDRLIAMKSGGQNLDELTKFCKELAKKGLEDKNRIELLAESESEEEEFHHPFMVKDRPLPNPISMLIGEPRETLPPVARAVAKSQRMLEFPVSSGNAHRVKEVTVDPLGDWKPVEKEDRKAITMEVDEDEMLKMHEEIEAEDAALAKEEEKNDTEEKEEIKAWKLSEAEKANMINPLGVVMFGGVKELPEEKKEEVEKERPAASATPLALPAPKERLALPAPSGSGTSAGTLVQHKLSENPDKVFDTAEGPVVDIGTIISNRLNAMRKLQETPNDAEALQDMYNAQKQMANWATSKNKPGQFVGSTGARVLSHHELNLGLQCWARKDQFTNAAKVSGGFGEFLLKKMGWSDGDGLGKHRNGTVDPLILDIKFDKKGLMAEEENRRGKVVTMTGCKDLSSKHPVSALMELCSKRRWGPPTFEQAFECGPPHKKQYVFKVTVDGKEYMPTVAVDNKKKAKSNSAMACLQQMGLLAKDPDNPV